MHKPHHAQYPYIQTQNSGLILTANEIIDQRAKHATGNRGQPEGTNKLGNVLFRKQPPLI